MSDDLYFTRLRWHAGRGIAKLHGRSVPLAAPPVLAGAPVNECDYAPEYGFRLVRRRSCDRVDDMTGAEIADADALLRALVQILV